MSDERTNPRIPAPGRRARHIGDIDGGAIRNAAVPFYKDAVIIGLALNVVTGIAQAAGLPIPEQVATSIYALATTIAGSYAVADYRRGSNTVVGRLSKRPPRGCAPVGGLARLLFLGVALLAAALSSCLLEAAPLGRSLAELGQRHGRVCVKRIGAEIVAYSPPGNYTAVCEYDCDGRVFANQPCQLFREDAATATPQTQ